MRGMITEFTEKSRKQLAANRARARTMRRHSVTMEDLFWSVVRNRKLGGYKFKRQYLIGNYIVDFVCVEHKLIVELDGPFHVRREKYDEARDTFLRAKGYRVMRFRNDCAADNIGIVLATVRHALDTGTPSP